MSLYYTLDEFIETLQKELHHLTAYTRMLGYIRAQEAFHLKAGVKTSSQIKVILEALLLDADTNIEDIETKLTVGSNVEVDFTKYAHEVRVGALVPATEGASGYYHHAGIFITGTPGTIFTVNARDADEVLVDGFSDGAGGVIFAQNDIVEIFNTGHEFITGLFTISAVADTTTITLAEAANLNQNVDDINPAYNVVLRLRER